MRGFLLLLLSHRCFLNFNYTDNFGSILFGIPSFISRKTNPTDNNQ